MVVPKAAVNENDSRILGEYDVRRAGQIAGVETIAKALCEKTPPNLDFELGILRSNCRHHLASGLPVYCIRHFSRSIRLTWHDHRRLLSGTYPRNLLNKVFKSVGPVTLIKPVLNTCFFAIMPYPTYEQAWSYHMKSLGSS